MTTRQCPQIMDNTDQHIEQRQLAARYALWDAALSVGCAQSHIATRLVEDSNTDKHIEIVCLFRIPVKD